MLTGILFQISRDFCDIMQYQESVKQKLHQEIKPHMFGVKILGLRLIPQKIIHRFYLSELFLTQIIMFLQQLYYKLYARLFLLPLYDIPVQALYAPVPLYVMKQCPCLFFITLAYMLNQLLKLISRLFRNKNKLIRAFEYPLGLFQYYPLLFIGIRPPIKFLILCIFLLIDIVVYCYRIIIQIFFITIIALFGIPIGCYGTPIRIIFEQDMWLFYLVISYHDSFPHELLLLPFLYQLVYLVIFRQVNEHFVYLLIPLGSAVIYGLISLQQYTYQFPVVILPIMPRYLHYLIYYVFIQLFFYELVRLIPKTIFFQLPYLYYISVILLHYLMCQ